MSVYDIHKDSRLVDNKLVFEYKAEVRRKCPITEDEKKALNEGFQVVLGMVKAPGFHCISAMG